jgi:phosphoribosylpyrophosphate synthetase
MILFQQGEQMIETIGHLKNVLGMKTSYFIGVHAVFSGTHVSRNKKTLMPKKLLPANTIPHESK